MNSGSDQSDKPAHRLGPVDVLWFAAWCGLAGGELEVASRVVRRAFSTTDRIYLLTRHFFWLVPHINLTLFLGFGVLCAVATRSWPRRAGWPCPRLIVVWAVLPALLIVGRGIYPAAWLVFKWLHPMRGGVPTLAEYLGSLGSATPEFVGNTFYCAYDSGLDRGFTNTTIMS